MTVSTNLTGPKLVMNDDCAVSPVVPAHPCASTAGMAANPAANTGALISNNHYRYNLGVMAGAYLTGAHHIVFDDGQVVAATFHAPTV